VLVHIGHTITGEMLGTGGQSMLLHATHDRLCKVCDAFWIIAERAGIGDRITRLTFTSTTGAKVQWIPA
jgi:hypothetical protein